MALSSSSPAIEGRRETEPGYVHITKQLLTTSQLDKTNGGTDQVKSSLFLNQFPEKNICDKELHRK